MISRTHLATAIALIFGTVSTPMLAAVCKPNAAAPFTASAPSPVNGFAAFLTDSEGVGLEICTDADCFFDPVVPGNAFSERIGFGAEGFWYLAESSFSSANTDVLVVMAAEAAFAVEIPNDGEQFPFTRLRIRVTVPEPGLYTVIHPYGSKTYQVDSVFDAKGRRTKRQINDTVDIEFRPAPAAVSVTGEVPAVTNKGVVGPWLRKDGTPLRTGFIGDGVLNPPTPVVGSPCGQNYVKVIAKKIGDAAGVISIDPNNLDGDNDPSTLSNNLFVVQGKRSSTTLTPLTVDHAYYSGSGDSVDLHVFTTAPTTASVSVAPVFIDKSQTPPVQVNGEFTPLKTEATGRFYASIPVVSPNMELVSVLARATNGTVSPERTVSAPVTDLITVTEANASCLNTDTGQNCSVTVSAKSSAGSDVELSVVLGGAVHSLGDSGTAVIQNLKALPSRITVTSKKVGALEPLASASRALTVNN